MVDFVNFSIDLLDLPRDIMHFPYLQCNEAEEWINTCNKYNQSYSYTLKNNTEQNCVHI